MLVDDSFHERKPQPHALHLAGETSFDLIELIENLIELLRRNSWAIIMKLDLNARPIHFGREHYFSRSTGIKFYIVFNQITKDFLHPDFILLKCGQFIDTFLAR